MQLLQDDLEVRLAAVSVARARVEHVEWAEILTYCEQLAAEHSQENEFFRRQSLMRSIPLEIGLLDARRAHLISDAIGRPHRGRTSRPPRLLAHH